MNARALALRALSEMGNRHTDELVDSYLTKYRGTDPDRRLFSQLVIGVVERRIYLDYVIDQLASRKPDGVIRDILRLGIYQLQYLNIPPYAAVHETASLADKVGEKRAKGFVNAVLREFLRCDLKVSLPKEIDRRISVSYSYPLWLVRYWIDLLGAERAEKLAEAGNEKPPLTLRVSATKITREKLIEMFGKVGIKAEPTPLSPIGVRIEDIAGKRISDLPGFEEGYFTVQDESSQLAVCARLPKAGDVCVDVCCSPGGKMTHLAEYASVVYGFDVDRKRLRITMKNALRMQCHTKVRLDLADAVKGVRERNDTADYVLVDAPCSALGTIRRNPDIKYNRIKSDILKNAKTQRLILKRASQYVKKGGVLLYSTCTITREENEDQIRRFLEKNPDFSLSVERLLLPSEDGTDGFYFAVMERK